MIGKNESWEKISNYLKWVLI